MHYIKNLKIGVKLISSFVVVSLIMIFIGYYGIAGMRAINKNVEKIVSKNMPSLEHLLSIDRDIHKALVAERSMIFASVTSDLYRELISTHQTALQYSQYSLDEYSKIAQTEEEKTLLSEFQVAVAEWKKLTQNAVDARSSDTREGRSKAIDLTFGIGKQKFDVMRGILGQLIDINTKMAEKTKIASHKTFSSSFMMLSVVILIGVVLGMGLGYLISRIITKSLSQIVAMLKDVAEGEGDLTKRLEVNSKDEIGDVARWFNTFIDKLHGIITSIANSTHQLASASEELSASSSQITSGTEKQRAQTEQMATSMEEMSATVMDIAKNANEAAESSKSATEKANKGGEIVKNTVEGMNKIADAVKESAGTIEALKNSSEQIGEIISVIDDIADQTNLLALNAAIEAARAGEQGRGFAVVADEVRKLAERTTKATKEIADMIKSIQADTGGAVSSMEAGSKEVESGVKLTHEAGESLKQIVAEVQKVTDMVQQIATSTEQQSTASEEISSNVESVSTVVKETSSSIQESNHAVQELSRLATELNEIVDQFKLAKEETAEGTNDKEAVAKEADDKKADDKEPEEK